MFNQSAWLAIAIKNCAPTTSVELQHLLFVPSNSSSPLSPVLHYVHCPGISRASTTRTDWNCRRNNATLANKEEQQKEEWVNFPCAQWGIFIVQLFTMNWLQSSELSTMTHRSTCSALLLFLCVLVYYCYWPGTIHNQFQIWIPVRSVATAANHFPSSNIVHRNNCSFVSCATGGLDGHRDGLRGHQPSPQSIATIVCRIGHHDERARGRSTVWLEWSVPCSTFVLVVVVSQKGPPVTGTRIRQYFIVILCVARVLVFCYVANKQWTRRMRFNWVPMACQSFK